MSEANTPRLMAAAKEFNIGKDTLVEFLIGKGFSKDDLKPTSRLTEAMYYSLQQEFSSDKAAKAKSDAIEIPKGSTGEGKKKRDEEEIVFKKGGKKTTAEEDIVIEPTKKIIPEEVKSEPVVEVEKLKIEAPELDGPKLLHKIDLDAIDSSTRPKKAPVKPKKDKETEVEQQDELPIKEEESKPTAE